MTLKDVDDILDAICIDAIQHQLAPSWLPVLQDSDDEPLVQLALEGGADAIITHNVRHLRAAKRLGILILTPREFLESLRGQDDDDTSKNP